MSFDQEYRSWIESLNEIPMEEVIDELGLHRLGNSFLCPNPKHHDRNLGNCTIYDNRYHCFSCNDGGDNIHLVEQVCGLKFKDAAESLAKLMGMPIIKRKRNRVSPEKRMPLSSSELSALGLIGYTQRVFMVTESCQNKPDFGEFKKDLFDGYLTGKTELVSAEKLFRDDPEAFFALIAGKFQEVSETYKTLYESKVWEWGLFESNTAYDIEKALEIALKQLAKIAEKLTAAKLVDLSYFSLPSFPKKRKSRYRLQV